MLSAVYFGAVMGVYGMSFWLPQIVEDMGVKSTLTIGLITAIPWAVAAVAMVFFGRHSDKTQERRWHVAVAALAGALGFVLAALLGGSAVASLAALTLAIVGVMCVLSSFWALPTALLSGAGAAAGIALINSVGNLAGQLSPSVVGKIRDVTGETTWGMYVLAASMLMSCIVVLLATRERVARTTRSGTQVSDG